MKIFSLVSFVFFTLMLCSAQAVAQTTPPKGAILTWHDDNLRTGWQQQETILSTSTIGSLGISHSVGLADQVDAQPLVIPWATQTLFLIAYVNVNNATPSYFLHALNLTTLNDKGSPLLVQASHTLTTADVASFD